MKTAISLAVAVLALMPSAGATPLPVDFHFKGYITGASNEPHVNTVIEANNSLSGYFLFDGNIKATTAGHWDLPNAVLHLEIDRLVVDAVGATAQMITPNRDYFSFIIDADTFIENVPPADQFAIQGAFVEISFFTFLDGYFSEWNLPIVSPPRDQHLYMELWGADWVGHASTDTNFHVTAVPEPGSLALIGGGLLALAARRRKHAR